MKKFLNTILFLIINIFLNANYNEIQKLYFNTNYYSFLFKIKLLNSDLSSDFEKFEQDIKNEKNEKENILLKDLDFSWIKEKNRLEKMFIGIGGFSIAIGLTLSLAGILNYFVSFTDKTQLGDNISIGLMGTGGGITLIGSTFLIVGVARLEWFKYKAKNQKK